MTRPPGFNNSLLLLLMPSLRAAPEDSDWVSSILPGVKVVPVRFATEPIAIHGYNSAGTAAIRVPGFSDRQGLVWMGSGHSDNMHAIRWVVRRVLPILWEVLEPKDRKVSLFLSFSKSRGQNPSRCVVHKVRGTAIHSF
jgi:hypothetical protein